jgi:hypothetical protein
MNEKILHTTTPTARKEHICAVCGKPIAKGEKYLNVAVRKDGKLTNRKTHLGCAEDKEKVFKKAVHDDTLAMLETFSFEENMQIAFTPVIITEVAWKYAYIVLDYAAKARISETRKLSRTVKMLREKYICMCKKDLNRDHFDRMTKASEDFIGKCGNDFLILFYSLSNELKKQWADLAYLDMRTYAGIALIVLELLKEHTQRMDKLIAKRFKREALPTISNPITDALRDCMEAYLAPARFSFDGNVKISMNIIRNKFNQIQWEVK